MKASPLVCLLALAAMVSTAPQSPIPISNNSKSKSIEEIKSNAPTVPVPGVTPAESKPKEWLSSTPTVADRSRCLNNYRSKKPDAPPQSAVEIASPHQYPFVVSIFYYEEDEGYSFKCSGSLISPTHVLLTASSCLYYNPTYSITYSVENLRVRLGTQFSNETTSDAQLTKNVRDINIHGNSLFFGFAIVTMDSPVEFTDTISPICLVLDCFDDESGQSVIAMGWEYSSRPDELQTKNSAFLGLMRLSTLPMTTCLTKDVDGVHNENVELCAKKECGDFCRNYRGGPVVIENNSLDDKSCRFMQVGVFDHFADGIEVGTFLRVKKYLTWIVENTE